MLLLVLSQKGIPSAKIRDKAETAKLLGEKCSETDEIFLLGLILTTDYSDLPDYYVPQNFQIKRKQSDARISYAEREESQ